LKKELWNSSFEIARTLFPHEEWILTEQNIWVAKSRLKQRDKELEKWEKEMAQVRILTNRGSNAYFLPEKAMNNDNKKQCADLVLDNEIVEMKMVSGSRVTLGGQFRYGLKQGSILLKDCNIIKEHSVFIWLLTDLSVGSVKAKIAGELKGRKDEGRFICLFEKTGDLYSWTYKELKNLIGR